MKTSRRRWPKPSRPNYRQKQQTIINQVTMTCRNDWSKSYIIYRTRAASGDNNPACRTIGEQRVIFSSESPFVIYLVLFLFISCMILSSALYFVTQPNRDRIDNDLKYRYIKMNGEATPDRIAELEELFELNRDNAKIRQKKKTLKNMNTLSARKSNLKNRRDWKNGKSKNLTKKLLD